MAQTMSDPSTALSPPPYDELALSRRKRRTPLLTAETGWSALKQSFVMLRPDIQWRNPVMFVVEVGAFLTLAFLIEKLVAEGLAPQCTSSCWTSGCF